jgi:hypothetical protein
VVVRQIDTGDRLDVRRFVELPYRLYRNDRRWVPPLRREAAFVLNRRHPFYDRSDAAFFVAERGREIVGRIAAVDHVPYNQAHDVRQASFAFFECEQDHDAARELFARVDEWAHARGLNRLVGPKGLSAFDGYGLLVEGFAHRQLMTMTNYNPEWYPSFVDGQGFTKEVDFVSFELSRDGFVMPDAVRRAAQRATRLRIVRYSSTRSLIRAARGIGATYNRAFINNWEYYPLTDREVAFLISQVRPLADHRLMTFIAAGDETVGFLLAFPDVSAALQRMQGRLTPFGLLGLLAERRRTVRVALNGAGIVPEYQGHGGNALLYTQIEGAIRTSRFDHAELPQVAETAVRMRRDLQRLGARPLKTHRVYARPI